MTQSLISRDECSAAFPKLSDELLPIRGADTVSRVTSGMGKGSMTVKLAHQVLS
ncbi:MAG: hypothetical protein AAF289_00890 [Cyanobacteria bacterium P01_A01_bin.135]